MKKWFIALAALALLLLIPGVAMADTAMCPTCNAWSTFEPTGKYANKDLSGHQKIQKCTTCRTEIPLGSHEAHTETQKATCTSRAYCAVCQGYYGLTNPNNHIESRKVVYETKDFYEHYKKDVCAGCEKVLSEVAYSHNPKEAATCVSAAICKDCGQNLGLDMGNHNWSEWKIDESEPLMHYRFCQTSGCGESEREGHDGNANCVTSARCSKCLTNYKDTDNHIGPNTITCGRISDTEHQWTATCKACGHTIDRLSEAHTETTAATCTTAAYCDVCKSNYGSTDPNAHNLVQHKAKAPTCTAIGWDAYDICSRCDYSTYVEKSALGHDRVNHDAKAPTCTAIGWDAYQTCSRCDYTTYAEKSALGHDRVNHDAQAPTCTAIGWDAYETCSRCDYSTYVEKSALGHKLVNHDAQAPTCTEIGWDAYETCSRCDYTTYVEKSALGHDRVNHDAQAPTCTEIGWSTYDTCSRCDYSTYAELAALGHDYVAKTTKPSCTEKGYTTHTCTRCKDSYRDAYVAALGHWYGEWSPNADGTNSATCLRDAYEHTVDCARFDFVLAAEDVRSEFVLCPVCGEVSGIRLIDENGEVVETLEDVQLLLVENAAAKAVTERLPVGELVLRMGALPSGEMLMSVAFEWGGEPTQPTGQVKITLPAELLEGYALRLIAGDGAESELPLERDEEAETISFVLDFTDSETPVQLMRVVPEV